MGALFANGEFRPSSVRELRNVWLCRLSDELIRPEFCHLTVEEGRIARILPADYRKYLRNHDRERPCPSEETAEQDNRGVLDAAGRVASAPMVNFHEHFYSRLAKGLALPGPMQDFRNILENLWWRLDEALDADMIEACALLGSAESLRSGVSYVFDHHSSPGFVRGSLDIIAAILTEAGMRGVLSLETSDRHGAEIVEACLQEQRAFLRGSTNADLRGLVGLHAPFTLTDQTLRKAEALCSDTAAGIHIHLAEDRYEQRYSLDTFGCTAAVRLQRLGLLEWAGILAHGVHLEDQDWRAVGQGRCALAVNPDSNLNNAVGVGRYTEIPDPVLLVAGTDGMHASPSRSIKQLFLLSRHQGSGLSDAFHFVRRIYFDQIRFVRRFFPDYPSLNPGDRADLVIWDYRPPSPFSVDTFWGHLIYGILEAPAWTVCMQGRALVQDGALRSLDSERVGRRAGVQGIHLFEKLGVIDRG
jgi:cytosine/adenosine deaminase-related metal-dependent hydrolase